MTNSGPTPRHGRNAAVIGGSLAGLLAARVLADHFETVTVLERDRYPTELGPRKGVPQARHLHVLLVRGQRVMEKMFPGIQAEMLRDGANLIDATRDLAWLTPAGWGPRFECGFHYVACSRDLIDWSVLRRVRAVPNVTIREDVDATGLVPTSDGRGVAAVTLKPRAGEAVDERMDADLVVDAAGRSSRAPQWLEALGYAAPEETIVNAFIGYTTRLYRRPVGVNFGWESIYIQSAPPAGTRAGVIFPIEGGRWIVTLGGSCKDYPPTDEAGFLAFAGSLPAPEYAKALELAEPLGPIVGHRSTENRLRHYERLNRMPNRFLVTGDAACAFNPVYGQGMTTAGLGAEVLDDFLRACRPAGRLDGLPQRFQKRLARSNSVPWTLSTSEDFRHRETEGTPPGRTVRFLHRYLDYVIGLGVEDRSVRKTMLEVFHLIRPPSSLFRPRIASRALWRMALGRPVTSTTSATPALQSDSAQS